MEIERGRTGRRPPGSGARVGRAAALALGLVATPCLSQPVPLGSQFQVNTYTTSTQLSRPVAGAVAVGPGGEFVVVWDSYGSAGSDTDGSSIQGQRFANDGSASGGEFQINSYTTGAQLYPFVATGAAGEFVVAWDSTDSAGSDTDGSSIQGQRFDGTATAAGGQFQVNSYTTASQYIPSVALEPSGNFVIAWMNDVLTPAASVQGQRFDGGGSALGGEFQVDSLAPYLPVPALSGGPSGEFVVVWQSYGSAGSDSDGLSIQGQRFDGAGNAVGGQFQVNSYTTSDQYNPAVAVGPGGEFVVSWHSYGSAGTDTSGSSIQVRRFDSSGTPVGGEFQVNSYTTSSQYVPSVAMGPSGEFVVAWMSDGSAGTDSDSLSIQAQLFDSSGAVLGGEFQVNSYTTSTQYFPSAAVGPSGEIVVSWTSNGSPGTDTSSESVQAQRYLGLLDFGDAPAPYPTLAAADGARHHRDPASVLFLGAGVDGEGDGQPAATADGDDTGFSDDEDGVVVGDLAPGGTASVTVTANASALLNAWVDFNADGDWLDSGEQVFVDVAVTGGSNALSFSVPLSATVGTTFARFRLDSTGSLTPTGLAADGEVEDELLPILNPPDLSLSKTDGGITAVPGSTVAYTLGFANPIGSATANGVVLTDTVPADATFDPGASTPGWVCLPGNGPGSSCTLGVGSVVGGSSGGATFAVTVDNPLGAGVSQIINGASIADDGSGGADPNLANNAAMDTTPVSAAPDLTLGKADGGAVPTPGSTLSYTLSYGNVGVQDASGVFLSETVPTTTTFDPGSSTPGWVCVPDGSAGSSCTLMVGALAAGAAGNATFAVVVDDPLPPGVTAIANTAAVADDGTGGPDPTPENNLQTLVTGFSPIVIPTLSWAGLLALLALVGAAGVYLIRR